MKKIVYSWALIISILFSNENILYQTDFNSGLGNEWRTLKALGGFSPKVISRSSWSSDSGKRLRLTSRKHDLSTAVTLDYEFPTQNNKFVLEFDYYAYGGCSDDKNYFESSSQAGKWGADGMAIILFDSSAGVTPRVGASGGSLGYANGNIEMVDGRHINQSGFEKAWIGIGLDAFGAFSNNSEGRKNINGRTNTQGYQDGKEHPNSVAIRGDARNGYRLLKVKEVQESIARAIFKNNGHLSRDRTQSYWSGRYRLSVDSTEEEHLYIKLERKTSLFGSYQTIIDRFDAMAVKYHQGTKPKKFRLAFSSGTGGGCNNQEIDNVTIYSKGEIYTGEKLLVPASCSEAPQKIVSFQRNFSFDAHQDVSHGSGGIGTVARYRNVALVNHQQIDLLVKVVDLENMNSLYKGDTTPKGFKFQKIGGSDPSVGFFIKDNKEDPQGTEYEATLEFTFVKSGTNEPVTFNFETQVYDLDNFANRTERVKILKEDYLFFQTSQDTHIKGYASGLFDLFENKEQEDSQNFNKNAMVKFVHQDQSSFQIHFSQIKNKHSGQNAGRAGFNLVFGATELGLPSCQPSLEPMAKKFTCNTQSFISYNTSYSAGSGESKFDTVSLEDGSLIGADVVSGVNGVNSIGYNIKDNYIWGYNLGAYKVVRIDADLKVKLYDVEGLDRRFYVAADVSKEGVLYLFSRGNSNERRHLARVDLESLKALSEVTLDKEINTADMAFNPVDGKLYFIQNGTDVLYSITLSDDGKRGHVHKVGSMGLGRVSPIINFFDKYGNFYFNKDTYWIYKVNPLNSAKATKFTKLSKGLRNGDGARCPNAKVVQKPEISILDTNVTEGDSGVKSIIFKVLSDQPIEESEGVPIRCQLFDGTAKAGSDYTSSVSVLTQVMPKGATSMVFSFPVIKGDKDVESDETLIASISSGSKEVVIVDANATGTILNDDKEEVVFDAWDVGKGVGNRTIDTKVVGENISVKVVSLNSAKTLLTTAQVSDVKVALKNGGIYLTPWHNLSSIPFVGGFLQGTTTFTPVDFISKGYAHKAFKNVVVAISYSDSNGTVKEVSSSDRFAIRPKRYEIAPLASSLKAGETFSMQIKALDAQNHVVDNYNEENLTYTINFEEQNSIACVEGNLSISKSGFNGGIAQVSLNYEEAGRLLLKVQEREGYEYASIDRNTTADSKRYILAAQRDSGVIHAGKFTLNWDFLNGGSDYTYFSSDPQEMGAKVAIEIGAKNMQDRELKNFTKECYAQDIQIALNYHYSNALGYTPHIVANYERNETIYPLSFPQPLPQSGILQYKVEKEFFHQGYASKEIKFNFQRDARVALNPMAFFITQIALSTPTFSLSKSANKSVQFVYARAHVPNQEVVGKEGEIKVFYEAYCKHCDKRAFGIDNLEESSDSVFWYILPSIDTALDYELPSDVASPLPHGHCGSIIAGYRDGIRYLSKEREVMTIESQKTPLLTKGRYVPKEYLKFNLFNPHPTEHSFFVSFTEAPQKWAGSGQLGATVDIEASPRTNQIKIDW